LELKVALASVALVMVLLASVGAGASTDRMETLVASYLAHEPIVISGDGDLTEENGVTGGSGTPDDPFLIEGWKIDISGSTYQSPTGIHVQHTTASLVIRDVMVHSGSLEAYDNASTGILLYGVENCVVEGARSLNNTEGIYLINCVNITVEGCDSRDNMGSGIMVESSADLSVANTTFMRNNRSGIEMHESAQVRVYGNSATDNAEFGVDVRSSEDVEVCSNTISRNLVGVNVGYSNGVEVTDNLISENEQALVVYHSDDAVIGPNTLLDNELDLSAEEGGFPVLGALAAAAVAAIVCAGAFVVVMRRRAA
jgi:parallel beta-helix repeat protein